MSAVKGYTSMRAKMQESLSAYTGTLDLFDYDALVRLEALGKAHLGIQQFLSDITGWHNVNGHHMFSSRSIKV